MAFSSATSRCVMAYGDSVDTVDCERGPLVGLWESLLGEEEREREFLDERVSSSWD